ncbi:MAG TPA: hypothetical protein ENI11_01245 [Actinobacteria bacterium]|nr:hypothetical protein [Actinomycetota bacterium]
MCGIYLVTFGNIQQDLLLDLSHKLGNVFKHPVISGYRHELPESAFDEKRDQYLASSFLMKLRQVTGINDSKILGITEVDLYSPGLNFVFGQADVGGKASMISLARLYPKEEDTDSVLFRERALKEATHELGHTFGLEHCRDKHCVMFFSNGIQETDIKSTYFCPHHLNEYQRDVDMRDIGFAL